MANTNFIVHNGLTVGPVTVDAATGDMSGVGNLVLTGTANVSSIQNGNSNVRVAANANVTISSTGTANVFTVTGTGANISGTLGITGQVTSTLSTGTAPLVVTSTTQVANLNVATAGTAGTVTTAAQPNITSVGNLTIANIDNIQINDNTISSTNTNGNIVLSPNGTGNVVVNDALIPGANATYTLGASGAYWTTIYGTATTALYADLAENYLADKIYEPGTVVSFGGKREITMTDTDMDTRVAGVVSTNPAHLMNGGLEGPCVTPLALTGRVPTKVVGPVRKGDLMVSTADGRARPVWVEEEPLVGSIIGKSLENFDGDEGTIEIVVGRV